MSTISAGTTSTTTLIHSGDTTGSLVLKTNDTGSGGTTAVTIDTSQNVGIGNTTVRNKLDVVGNTGIYSTGATSVGSPLGAQVYIGDSNYNTASYYNAAPGFGAVYDATYASAAALAFYTYAGTPNARSERMRIDASGRVLINKTSSDGGQLNVQNSSTTTRAYVNATLRNSRTASTHYSVVSWNGSLVADAWIGQVPSTDALCFGFDAGTTISESMRLATSGELLIGTTSQLGSSQVSVVSSQANQMVYLRNSNATPGGIFVNYSVATPNNTGSEFFFGNDPAQTRVTLRSNGGIANYSANNVNLSDRREKTNFAPAKSYLDVICAIPVQTFNYIDQNLEEDDGLTLGVVAQDVQAVAPELVSESDWSPEKDGSKMRLSIYQTDLQYALMKCIQEQQALIQQLQADVAALKGTS